MIIIVSMGMFVLGCVVAIWVHSYLYGKKWFENFDVDVAFSDEQAGEGDVIYLYETITNRKDMILPAVCVKFKTSKYLAFGDLVGGSVSDYFYRNDVLSVRGYEKVRRKLPFCCTRRGEYEITEAEIVGNDSFLREKFIEKKQLDAKLLVYPAMVPVNRLVPVFQKSYGELPTSVPLFEDPFEYVGVRDYMPGDAMARIHWKASAHTGKWQVKTSAYMASEPVVILLHLKSPGTFVNRDAMEENIRIAYSLVQNLSQKNIRTTLVVNGDNTIRLSGIGRGYISEVRHQLARISYENVERQGDEFFEKERPGISGKQRVFFVSSEGKPKTQEAMMEYVKQGISVTWVATIYGGEDDTKSLMAGLEPHLYRWKS